MTPDQIAESVVTLAEVIRAAEELADTVEDHLYVEGDYREALVAAWRAFCGTADSCADPLLKRVQSEYWNARDRSAHIDGSKLSAQDVIEGHDGTHGPCSICGVEPARNDGSGCTK